MESNWRFNVAVLGLPWWGPTLAARLVGLEERYLLNWSLVANNEWMVVKWLPGAAVWFIEDYSAREPFGAPFPGSYEVEPD